MGPARRRGFLGDRINKTRVVIALGTWGLHTPGLGLGLWCEVAEKACSVPSCRVGTEMPG